MKKVEILRKKYPRFVYENFDWEISRKDLKISFCFGIEPNIEFHPKVIIKNINKNQIKRVGVNPPRVVDNLVFNLGLIELLSYWKATCSQEIVIEAGQLNQEQIKWWKDLIDRGMSQFFYENKIDFRKPNFIKFKSADKLCDRSKCQQFENFSKEKVLVPVGGGKDSIVTLELLKNGMRKALAQPLASRNSNVPMPIACFSLNPTEAAKKIMKMASTGSPQVAGCKHPIIVERKIDKKLLELNRKGFLNGHTPFSAYLAFLSVLCAVLFNYKSIAFSNERSSNEGNLKYLGRIINHQYSKSFDFEKKFRDYSKRYLAKNVEYFSFLRPLYEIQIAKLLSKYPQYFSAFLSCNEAYKTYSGKRKPTRKWCGKCPKCLFVFAILYPFIDEKKLEEIFGKNLFENRNLLPLMLELIGERKFKPFECVGTKKESLIAFYLGWKKSGDWLSGRLPYILKYFEKNILPKYPNLEKEARIMMNSWSNQHNLPKEFEKILN